MTVILATLGECRATTDCGRLLRCPDLAVVLMAYLYDIGHPLSRKDIAALLWPQAMPDAQLTNLRSLLRRSVKAFGATIASPLLIGPVSIELDRAAVRVDFEFHDATESLPQRLKRLISAVSSGVLRGHVETSSALHTWLCALENRIEGMLHHLVRHSGDGNDAETDALVREATFYLMRRKSEQITFWAGDSISHVWGQEVVQPLLELSPATTPDALPMIPRVALLPPLMVKEADPLLYRLACGLVEDVTIDLCRERTFAVVSPYTADKLRGEANKAEFLQRHHVTYALDTRLSGDTLVVQLIFYPADEVIWASRLSLGRGQLISGRQNLLSDLCVNVTGHLRRSQGLQGHYLVNADAYRNYLLGSQKMLNLTLPAIRKARKHFKEALTDAGDFALVLSSLARTLYMEWLLTARGDPNLLVDADRLARQAIAVDQLQSSGYRELGMTQIYLGDLDQSVAALAHAETLSPHHADGLYSFGDTLVHASRPAEALVKLESAIDHSPITPDSYLWSAAGANYFLGRYAEAVTLVNRMNDPSPADRIAAAAYAMAGDMRQARLRVRRVMEANPSFDVSKWLGMVPFKDQSQRNHYREGLLRAGFQSD